MWRTERGALLPMSRCLPITISATCHGANVCTLACTQYNPWGDLTTLPPDAPRLFPHSNGSVIAVSYEARRYGVKRWVNRQEALAGAAAGDVHHARGQPWLALLTACRAHAAT